MGYSISKWQFTTEEIRAMASNNGGFVNPGAKNYSIRSEGTRQGGLWLPRNGTESGIVIQVPKGTPEAVKKQISVTALSTTVLQLRPYAKEKRTSTINTIMDYAIQRQKIGPVVTGALIFLAETAEPDPDYPANEAAAMQLGEDLFVELASVREGSEGIITPTALQTIHADAAHIQSAALTIGRGMTQLLHAKGHPAHRVTQEALAALELDAIAQIAAQHEAMGGARMAQDVA
jgi:hypothetical protein